MRWKVIYLKGRDIYLTGRDIYFEKGHNLVTNYSGDEILIMCTSPNKLVYIQSAADVNWKYEFSYYNH